MIPAGFHFLRPDWLFAILPALLLAGLAWRGMGTGRSDWRHVVDAHLLKHLALRDETGRRKWPVVALFAGWVLAAIAMAGPAWQKVPAPALDRLDPTVVVLSLAQSMNATDQNPSRLVAARHKVEDILSRMRGGQVALVIYADAPFVAAPLTEDGRVVAQMLPELATDLMPVLNDRPDLAVQRAVELLKNTGAPTGRIVLITDGAGESPTLTRNAVTAAAQAGYPVSVIGVGTGTGSPLTGFDGSPVRGKDGAPLTTRMDAESLAQLAAAGHGRFTSLTADGRDLDTIFANPLGAASGNPLQSSGLTADQWVDMGSWFVIAVALLASLAFRRGWLAVIPLAVLLAGGMPGWEARAQSFSDPAEGLAWGDMWQTPDQKGASAFQSEDYRAAAKNFQNPAWQASALYKGGDYERAASAFAGVPGADYNKGNALARAGKLEDAVKAYDAALSANPGDADAAFNRDLVLKALEQQKKQQDQQQNQNQNQQNQQSPDDKKGGGSAQNKPDPQKQDQQKQDQQKQDDPQKQPDQKQPDQKQAGQSPPPPPQGDGKDEAKKDQPKPDPQKPGQQNPPAPSAGNQKQDQPQQPPPAPQKQADAPPPQPAPNGEAQNQPPPPPPGPPPGAVAVRPMTEQDQNREQVLRMVPDDPTGLLRARIRSHYSGTVVPTVEESP
ncbi:VWA domain-containing protein [Aquabacter sp. CN5-332]|uniref:VWA domain-containing protein n=1 Tax=Aquabacter sp. CN5-332 TaxID=3156608 RepID=UPI0032B31AE7